MRSFLYTKVHRTGLKTTYRVYEMKRNMPLFIGPMTIWNGSNRGSLSEVFDFLIYKKIIPKKYFSLSECNWRAPGYYCQEVEDKGIRITEI